MHMGRHQPMLWQVERPVGGATVADLLLLLIMIIIIIKKITITITIIIMIQ